ncbi:MAG: DUF456 domain-containing protein [Verrucomicrobia bacterium]|nr:DUF456 domain-containing protein [Verrucomicrobiota bacterium]
MSWAEIVGFGLALLVMGVGLLGSVLPGLPGPPLVVAAAVGHRLYFGEAGLGNPLLGVLIGLMCLSLLLDYVAGLLGARKLGATWRGVLGAAIGAIVGLFFGFVGVLIAPFLGAVLFELAGGREWREATRAGVGTVLGMLAGAVGKIACCLAMIGIFVFGVALR